MTRICLLRHGETDWNLQRRIQGITDIPLNARGRSQAHAAAEHLAKGKWDYLYSSPLGRALNTAEIIGAQVGISKIHQDPRLQERCFGEAEGVAIEVYRADMDRDAIAGLEPWEAVMARGFEAIEQLVLLHPGSSILAVSHGGLIRSILKLIGEQEIELENDPLRNASMNLLSHEDGRWRVQWYNRVAPELDTVTQKV
jgi:uncharacterized phosphatase